MDTLSLTVPQASVSDVFFYTICLFFRCILLHCKHVGAADLVPDVDRLRDSMVARRYIDRLPIYYLLCALEEGCLSTSANGAPQTNER